MKKIIQIFLIAAVALAVIGLARTGPAWAGAFQPAQDPIRYSPLIPASIDGAPLAARYTITDDGTYNIGGVCIYEVTFNDPDGTKKLKIDADAEIPVEESRQVPYSGEGDLFFPGCHFVNYKQEEVVNPMLFEDANTKVCFGTNPDFEMFIYYYLDNPTSGSRVWTQLTTSLEDNGQLICANAPYTGVYMPAGELRPRQFAGGISASPLIPNGVGGSVLPPPDEVSFDEPGTYSVGGVCNIRAEYKVDGLSNDVFVSYPTDDTQAVPFPGVDNGDLLYFPGCHVIHYRDAELRQEMNVDEEEGIWEICFAARPGKEMTIYYYQDDLENITPPWKPLESYVKDGLVCAELVDFTAVYTPAGR